MKSLLTDPESENEAAATGAGPDAPGDGSAPEVAVERACPNCGAALAEDQEWCLECGQSTRERWSGLPGWRTGAAVIGATILLASGAVAAAYAALRSDGSDEPPAGAIAQNTPNADQIPPPPPIDIPEETEEEQQAAQGELPPIDESVPPADESLPPVDESYPPADESYPPVDESYPPADESYPPVDESFPPVDESTPPVGTTPEDEGDGKGGKKKDKAPPPVERQPLETIELDPATTVAAAFNPFNHDPALIAGEPSAAFDGDPATAWTVELPTPQDVETPAIGLLIDLGKATKLRRLQITTTTPGTKVEVYGTAEETAPAALDDDAWTHLATQLDVPAGEKTNITLGEDVTGTKEKVRQVMIWFAAGPDDGSTSVGISEIKLSK